MTLGNRSQFLLKVSRHRYSFDKTIFRKLSFAEVKNAKVTASLLLSFLCYFYFNKIFISNNSLYFEFIDP